MCGIVAVINRSGEGVEKHFLRRVLDAAAHRGPDGSGLWVEGGLGFGHRRLAIIDLSGNGAQPMHWADRYVMTYNGEVYNYQELRIELEATGVKFQSETDSEVILAAYASWGENCVSRFNGMWAFAIYDREEKSIFCSRDRFGVKPLYYCLDSNKFGLASEIRQLLPIVGATQLNRKVFGEYLVGGFLEHLSETFFTGVLKVPPGHNLRYDIGSGEAKIWRYYHLEGDPESASLSPEGAEERLILLLRDSVDLRLRADVKVGTCLSGGLDSSGLAVFASEMAREGTGSFCAIHAKGEDASSDESHYAIGLADRYDLDLHIISPKFADFQASVDEVVLAQGEPFASTSVFMQYFVMKSARELGCKVMLDGQGGDEVFFGYEKYYPAGYIGHAKRNPLRVMREVAASMRNSNGMTLKGTARFTVGALAGRAREEAYRRQNPHLKNGAGRGLKVTRELARAYWDHRELQRLELERTNLQVLLRYEDRNSMAHSVEARVPYLDYRLVEFALGLDISLKISEGWTKCLLRKALSKDVSDTIAWRKDKFGFNAPHDSWMRRHSETAKAEIARSLIIAEFCDLNGLLENFESLESKVQWRVYNTAVWERIYGVKL